MSDAELSEVLEACETALDAQRRDSLVTFARYAEIPGTPGKMSDGDLRRMLELKKQLAQGQVENFEPEDDVETDAVEFYPEQLELGDHHELILTAVQNLIEETPVVGPLANGHVDENGLPIAPEGVMFMLPPGSAKSTFASVAAPAWVMGRYRGIDVIGISYAADLARRFGRRTRYMCRQADYEETFGATVTADNQAVDQWSLTNDSTYRAVGVLGGVTGNRADIVFIDDVLAGREEAESEIIRDKTNSAIKDDIFTRLKPHGKVVFIGTRWHEADPMGTLLGEGWEGQSGLRRGTDGRWWLVINCPLVAEHRDDPLGRKIGDRLWPQWFTERFVELARAAGERTWSSLYQQRPSASDGNILLRSLWRCWPHGKPRPTPEQLLPDYKPELPKNISQIILSFDTAIEDGEENDFTAMTAWASFERDTKLELHTGYRKRGEIAKQQNLLMIGAWRAKLQSAFLADEVMQLIKHFKPDRLLIEKRASGAQLIQELRRRRPRWMEHNKVRDVGIEAWLPPFRPGANGKVPRAHVAAGVLAEGTVWYLPGRLTEMALKEASSFPNGRYADLVDTITQMLIWARNVNLLELPTDILDPHEEADLEADQHERDNDGFAGYGHILANKPRSAVARRLYG